MRYRIEFQIDLTFLQKHCHSVLINLLKCCYFIYCSFLFIKNGKNWQGAPRYCQHFVPVSHESFATHIIWESRGRGVRKTDRQNADHRRQRPTAIVVDIQGTSLLFVTLCMRGELSLLPSNLSLNL